MAIKDGIKVTIFCDDVPAEEFEDTDQAVGASGPALLADAKVVSRYVRIMTGSKLSIEMDARNAVDHSNQDLACYFYVDGQELASRLLSRYRQPRLFKILGRQEDTKDGTFHRELRFKEHEVGEHTATLHS